MESTTNRYEEVADENNLDVFAFEGFCENQHISQEEAAEAVEAFQDAYVGEFGSEEEFAEYFADEEGLDIPDLVRPHIDWSDVWHCELRHDFYEVNGHYFRNI